MDPDKIPTVIELFERLVDGRLKPSLTDLLLIQLAVELRDPSERKTLDTAENAERKALLALALDDDGERGRAASEVILLLRAAHDAAMRDDAEQSLRHARAAVAMIDQAAYPALYADAFFLVGTSLAEKVEAAEEPTAAMYEEAIRQLEQSLLLHDDEDSANSRCYAHGTLSRLIAALWQLNAQWDDDDVTLRMRAMEHGFAALHLCEQGHFGARRLDVTELLARLWLSGTGSGKSSAGGPSDMRAALHDAVAKMLKSDDVHGLTSEKKKAYKELLKELHKGTGRDSVRARSLRS